jgi:cytochrome c oxidase subunit 1
MRGSLGKSIRRWLGRGYRAVKRGKDAVEDDEQRLGDRETPEHERDRLAGIKHWLTTVDHADIGVLYLVFASLAALLGGLDAMMLRTELITSGAEIWTKQTYNALFTTHGITMLFLFATPAMFGIGNILVPALIGADDMAFPRINAFAFWILIPGALLIRAGVVGDLVMGFLGYQDLVHPAATGWTLYTPLSIAMRNREVDLLLLGLHLTGVSTIAASINFIVTIVEYRAPDVTWANLGIFTWTMLTTAGIALFAFPVLGSTLLMLLADRNFATAFFTGADGAILFQHLFWFFGHPEVYILVLPPMGVLSHVIPRFSARKLFGFRYVVYSTLAIGVLSFGVWAHHMFATGIDLRLQASFMAVTLAIAVPSAVKTFNWIATIWNGRVRLDAPMLFCVGAVACFIVGGVTGVFLGSIPVDQVYHGTYYVVGHFHLMLMGLTVFAAFAASYYWYPLLTGRMYNRELAHLHFWLTMGGTVAAFCLMFVLGIEGVPRRTATYFQRYAPWHQWITIAAYVIGMAQLIWVWNMVRSVRKGDPVEGDDPWNLRGTGLSVAEWDWFARNRGELPLSSGHGDDETRVRHPTHED